VRPPVTVTVGAGCATALRAHGPPIETPSTKPAHTAALATRTRSSLAVFMRAVWSGLQVHQRVSERVDRAFFRSAYDPRVILEDLAAQSAAASDRAALDARPAAEVVDAVLADVQRFRAGAQSDDLTLLVLRGQQESGGPMAREAGRQADQRVTLSDDTAEPHALPQHASLGRS